MVRVCKSTGQIHDNGTYADPYDLTFDVDNNGDISFRSSNKRFNIN